MEQINSYIEPEIIELSPEQRESIKMLGSMVSIQEIQPVSLYIEEGLSKYFDKSTLTDRGAELVRETLNNRYENEEAQSYTPYFDRFSKIRIEEYERPFQDFTEIINIPESRIDNEEKISIRQNILSSYSNINVNEIFFKKNLTSFLVSDFVRIDPVFEAPKVDQGATARQAHKFRSERVRMGRLGEITRDLQTGVLAAAKPLVSAVVRRAERLLQKTQKNGEMHRAYTPLLAGILSEADLRTDYMGRLDEVASSESDNLKVEARTEGLSTDVLVVGAGVQGSIFTARMRAEKPDVDMLTIDQAQKLGGQFRSYGSRPVFSINSRNFREEDMDIDGVPSGNGNLNSLGTKAPIQITDFTYETYPSNIDLGDAVAVNQHLSSPTMLGVELVDVEQVDEGYRVQVKDGETGEMYQIEAKKIINTTGLGSREQFVDEASPDIWSAERLFSHFGNEATLFPMDEFEGKRIAIVGGGDTGRVVAELLCRLGPKEAYGKSSVQLGGGPSSITWYGTEFENQEEFISTNRSRYQRLASFVRTARKRRTVGTIYPTSRKASQINQTNDGVVIAGSDGVNEGYDLAIDCTQLVNDVLVPFKNIRGVAETTNGYVPARGTIEIGKRLLGTDVYVAGPAAQNSLTSREKQTFADGIKENTAAIWANGVRTEALAERIALDLL